jgi:DHA1 family bicyclomycin/chloramphenicol resistance-like MFS transporter
MPSRCAAPQAMTTASVVVTLTLLLGMQPVTTDLYLPALPTLQRAVAPLAGTQPA